MVSGTGMYVKDFVGKGPNGTHVCRLVSAEQVSESEGRGFTGGKANLDVSSRMLHRGWQIIRIFRGDSHGFSGRIQY